ncbi:MAG: hypothetical protein EOR81_22850 [Mesorhizobium sp.]|nr:MAG: hypothetical protein EOR81_22850 [Mesorhizobium sp.]
MNAPSRNLTSLCEAYDAAYAAWTAELDRDIDPAKEDELDTVFSAARDRIFEFRPASIEELADKAAFLSTRWDQAEGMNRNRIRQLFISLGAPSTEPLAGGSPMRSVAASSLPESIAALIEAHRAAVIADEAMQGGGQNG